MHAILGQQRAIDLLQAALRAQRVHHAWIFAGPPGVGKFTAAVEFARVLLDPSAGPNLAGVIEADPASMASQLIDAGTHPDLHIIRKELALFSDNRELRAKKLLNIPIDLLRERMLGGTSGGQVHEAAAYRTAAHGHGKVFIIDEAELLDDTSQNALLKTLEEPPRETYIILITSRPDRLLPTIRSRCQIVQFHRLDAQAMAAWLQRAKLDAAPAEREWIERFADGSPGAATLAAEHGFFAWRETLSPMIKLLERGSYPDAMGETLAEIVEQFAVNWVKTHENASKDAANKDGARHLLSILAGYARARLAQSAARGLDTRAWTDLIELLRETERRMYANVNMKLLLENLVVQWASRFAVALK
jgi:DNA polymerase III subunit delta'